MIAGRLPGYIRWVSREGRKTKRKPIPDAAAGLIDEALMFLADARRALMPLVSGEKLSVEEAAKRPGLALIRIADAAARLGEIKKTAGASGG